MDTIHTYMCVCTQQLHDNFNWRNAFICFVCSAAKSTSTSLFEFIICIKRMLFKVFFFILLLLPTFAVLFDFVFIFISHCCYYLFYMPLHLRLHMYSQFVSMCAYFFFSFFFLHFKNLFLWLSYVLNLLLIPYTRTFIELLLKTCTICLLQLIIGALLFAHCFF